MARIFSPYRICPLGAHIDHQGGTVLGRTLALGTTLDYEPLDTNAIHIRSDQFGEAKFSIGELNTSHWIRYAQAAARLLQPQRGMKVHIRGSLIGAGLSSSASVGLAYLQALANVNGLDLSPAQLVQYEYELEHDVIGLQIGLLDPLTIVFGKRNAFLLMDTLAASAVSIPDPPSRDHAWIVAYSGVSRELTKSGFNIRVEECHQAARLLKDGARILSDVPRDLFETKQMTLPENLHKRATHYYTEVERVHGGAQAWQASNLPMFGQLMNQSCESSIMNYESGSAILVELYEIAGRASGVYGSRFSGGGYGGCLIALVAKDRAELACAEINDKFKQLHPDLPAKVFVVETGDGLAAPIHLNGGARVKE